MVKEIIKAMCIIAIGLVILLNIETRSFPDKIRAHYFNVTGKRLLFTSSNRTSTQQVNAMILLIKNGYNLAGVYRLSAEANRIQMYLDSFIYKDVEDSYLKAIDYVEDLKNNGVYISKHLCGKAIDISGKYYNLNEIENIFKNYPNIKMLRHNNHIHIESRDGC